ncbi:MAG: hypothetical protein LBQ56_02890 [Synergistaceae bacterium]|jgi:hypothetical protein|nr:hypothetical protein [Synergistaceae bacterium]
MGKNYSGTGIDTNIIGRMRIEGVPEPASPDIKRVAVLGLSEESHGNANGIGLADVTTRRLVEGMDRDATYLNCATTGFLMRGAIPVYLDTERQMMELTLRSLGSPQPSDVRLMQIHDTLRLTCCLASEALLPELASLRNVEILGEPEEMTFDSDGNLSPRVNADFTP